MKLGTFNLYNLQKANTPFYNKRDTEETVNKKIAWIKNQLHEMDTDICGYQELWDANTLEKALDTSHKLVVAQNPDGPSVALSTKYEVIEQEVISNFPSTLDYKDVAIPFDSFNRPILRAKVKVSDSLKLNVFVAHMKSKRPMILEGEDKNDPLVKSKGSARSLITRMSESIALREILLHYLKDRNEPVIALGDVNDSGTAVTTQIISGQPPFFRLPREQKLAIWDTLLYHAKDIQARQSMKDVYFTHIYNGHYESLDHVLVSQEFHRGNPNNLGFIENVRVLNDQLLDNTVTWDSIPRWKSDHGQVVVNVKLN